jgi:tyrosine-protein phosphatase SIW14
MFRCVARFLPSSAIAVLLVGLLPGASSPAPPVGVPNFHRVNQHIYRGAQPTPEGLQSLAGRGIKTIIDLRADGLEEPEAERLGMRFVHIPLDSTVPPPPADVRRALSVLQDRSSAPVFVHCQYGNDRTGMIIGCYRILHDRWSNRRALQEARAVAGRQLSTAMEEYILNFRPPARRRRW